MIATRAANHTQSASCESRAKTLSVGMAALAALSVSAGTSSARTHANESTKRSSKIIRAKSKYCGMSHRPSKSSPSKDNRSRAYASHASLVSLAASSTKGVAVAFSVLGPVTVERTKMYSAATPATAIANASSSSPDPSLSARAAVTTLRDTAA